MDIETTVEGRNQEGFRQPVLTREQAERIKNMFASARPRRTFRFHMKLVESDQGRRQIEGYASTRDLDRMGEIVEPGAFAESLKDFMANPILTYMHDWSNPIGKVVDARIDEVGLFIRAEISETAQKVWKLIEEGILRAFSIGYEVVEERPLDGVNHILRLRLYEVAVVSIPANRRALFSVTKALEVGNDLVCADCVKKQSDESDGSDELSEAHAILKEVMERLSSSTPPACEAAR
jgi:HK97 family phage prohead protease